MCDKCKPLINCPIGQKVKIPIKQWINKISVGNIEIVLDRYPDRIDTFIHFEETNVETGLYNNSSFEITNCPFCGKKLI